MLLCFLLPDNEVTAQHHHYSSIRLLNKSQARVAHFFHFPPSPPFFSSSKCEMGHGLHLLMVFHEPYDDCFQRLSLSSVAQTLNGWIWCHGDLWALSCMSLMCAHSAEFISNPGIHQPLSICLCAAVNVYVCASAAPFSPQLDVQSSAQSLPMPLLTGRFVSLAPELVFAR